MVENGRPLFTTIENGPRTYFALNGGDNLTISVNQVDGLIKDVQKGNGRWFAKPLLHIWGGCNCRNTAAVVHQTIVTHQGAMKALVSVRILGQFGKTEGSN